MKKEDLIKIVCELKNNINLSWIRGVYSIDQYTIIFELYKKNLKVFLVISIKKNNPRFHLLFTSKMPKEIKKDIPFQAILNKYIKGGQITDVKIYYPLVSINIKNTEFYDLIIDFSRLNIILLSKKGKIIASIISKIDNIENYLIDGKNALTTCLETSEKIGNLKFNRNLSNEFISNKTEEIKRKIIKKLEKELKKNKRLLEKLYQEKTEVNKKDYYKISGELLKYNLNRLEKGMKRVKLKDFDGNDVEILLNPELSPVENMENFFKKYKKLLNKEKPLSNRIIEVENKINALTCLIEKVEGLSTDLFPKRTNEIIKELNLKDKNHIGLIYNSLTEKRNTAKKAVSTKKEPFLKIHTTSGKLLLIGRNAIENELLIKKHSRGNDLWFHSEEVEGSHVVLKYNKKNENFSENDIKEASLIAAYYSKLRRYGEGNIVYTKCKNLSKPKEAKPGFVIYHNNKTIFVKIDDDKVKSLLEQSANQITI